MSPMAKALLMLLSTLFLALTLQGCGGCDEDAGKKCASSGTDLAEQCTALSKCYSDASCCDYESDGSKVKDSIAIICAGGGTDSCA